MSAGSRWSRLKPHRRVSFLLRPPGDDQRHRFGVNALAMRSDGSWLFTAGRDGTVRAWDVAQVEPTCVGTFEGHANWINDVFVSVDNRTLVTCSSDTTIKLWNTPSGECRHTLFHHTDYVQALAYSPIAHRFASGGLDRMVVLWDMETVAPVAISSMNNEELLKTSAEDRSPPAEINPWKQSGLKGGVYSLDISNDGSLVVTGGTEKILRGWDARSGKKAFKLRGHTDNVKAIVLSTDGTQLLSGSSDQTIRLWDIGQQRCVASYSVHSDSVWTLHADATFASVVSGGRDQSVFVTDLHTANSTLLFNEHAPVLKVLITPDNQMIWVSTSNSAVNGWERTVVPCGENSRERAYHSFSASPRASRMAFSLDDDLSEPVPVPLQTSPRITIPGAPAVVRHTILNDRQRVLTEDTSGSVALWDITRGVLLQDLGHTSFDEQMNHHSKMVCIPSWFAMDTKTGSIMVHLDKSSCFNAEIYGVDAGISGVSDDVKVNLGELLLRGLFRAWLTKRGTRKNVKEEDPPQGEPGDNGGTKTETGAEVPPVASRDSHTSLGDNEGDTKDGVAEKKEEKEQKKEETPLSFAFSLPDDIPLFFFENGEVPLCRCSLSDFTGEEGRELLPDWIYDCLVHGELGLPVDPPKLSFFLEPHDSDTLPILTQNKLHAPRIMRMRKVSSYIVGRLNLELPARNPENVDGESTVRSDEFIDILCNGQIADPMISIATARQYLWRNGLEDMVLRYRRSSPWRQSPATKETEP